MNKENEVPELCEADKFMDDICEAEREAELRKSKRDCKKKNKSNDDKLPTPTQRKAVRDLLIERIALEKKLHPLLKQKQEIDEKLVAITGLSVYDPEQLLIHGY